MWYATIDPERRQFLLGAGTWRQYWYLTLIEGATGAQKNEQAWQTLRDAGE